MKRENRHIRWLLGGILVLLLTACSSHNEGEEQQTVITFYVYAPERPMPTRVEDKYLVNPIEHESEIKSLQIWVFNHDNGHLVGYLSPKEDDYPTADAGKVYQMAVSQEFANAATKPNVDVYVAANAPGLSLDDASAVLSLGEGTTRAQLEKVVLKGAQFGPDPLCTTEVLDNGLPMSGVLLNQQVVGENPVLRIGDYETMAKVELQRTVSKVRFVFSQQSGGDASEKLTITGITLNGKVEEVDYGFPEQEYFFLGANNQPYHIGTTYIATPTSFPCPDAEEEIKMCEDPSYYVYDPLVFLTAQDYEDKIDEGVKGTTAEPDKKELTQVGPFYFRETDKKLRGTISYKIGTGLEQHKSFEMKTDLGFTRNHSWIIYAYYGSGGLDVLTVFVKPWGEPVVKNRELYNW